MDLKHILSVFTDDLIKKGKLQKDKINEISRLDLAFLIMDTYIKYPLPPKNYALIPYNYCALPLILPSYLSSITNN